MGGKSTFFKFFVVVILIVLLIFQILSMKQSDRLFERVNILEKNMAISLFQTALETTAAQA